MISLPEQRQTELQNARKETKAAENQGERTQHEGGSGRWSVEQTDALVHTWRECFADLVIHRNPAWRRILGKVNEKGIEKTMEQEKKKLRYLKDRYKEAADTNKRSGGARNVAKYYDIFDEVYRTRRLLTMNEVKSGRQKKILVQK
eukprot:gene21-611_t